MISLIVIATGPDRVVARAVETAVAQTAPVEILIVHAGDEAALRARLASRLGGRDARFVAAPSTTPGALRNTAVRASARPLFLIIDGSERLAADHASVALHALQASPEAAFAAAPGGPLVGIAGAPGGGGDQIDAGVLVGGAWAVGAALIRRTAFDEVNGFDEVLPGFVEWDLLLAIAETGRTGVLIASSASRYDGDDVRLWQELHPRTHLPAMRLVFSRHRRTFERLMRTALVERERLAKRLFERERSLLMRREQTLTELRATVDRITALQPALARYGRRTRELADLRRTSPVSRNWGSHRGLPVDRHYIRDFLNEHAGDVCGRVLEVLDAHLTAAFGGDRVVRSDVLDIDPGNPRATLVADLRTPDRLPADAYDCVILTQTLHLIDDMAAAVRGVHRLLKPGGVLLATLPCASATASEYGPHGDHWRVTETGARVLFDRVFEAADVTIRARGNRLTTAAFLYGLSCEDLETDAFDVDDPSCPLLVTVRARKPPAAVHTAGPCPRRTASAVLLYHRIADGLRHDTHGLAVPVQAFRSHLERLLTSWRIVPLQTLAAASAAGDLPDRTVALTFDDGYLDNLEVAAAVLVELGVPATFFLTSERRIDRRRFWWDVLEEALLWSDRCPETLTVRVGAARQVFETGTPAGRRTAHDELYARLKTSPPVVRDDLLAQIARQIPAALTSDAQRPMLDAEVQRLRAYPLIEIGAHTIHHTSLPELAPEDCHREVFESRTALERVTGGPVTSFAYPFGDLRADVAEAVRAAGYRCAVTREVRGLRPREDPLLLPRVPARNESGAELTARLLELAGQ